MRTLEQIQPIFTDLIARMRVLFGDHVKEAILFGSYARNDADEGSDIDVLVLVDLSRDVIAQYTWQLGEHMSELMLEYGIMVSPIVENETYFLSCADIVPLFRNVRSEGVRISA